MANLGKKKKVQSLNRAEDGSHVIGAMKIRVIILLQVCQNIFYFQELVIFQEGICKIQLLCKNR